MQRFVFQPRKNLRQQLAAVLFFVFASAAASNADTQPAPDPAYSPRQVIEIVVDALAQNGSTKDDAGIATVFRFAAPGNRANTGPLPRFTRMIKRGFADMLDHDGSRFDPIEIVGDKAVQAVWLTTETGQEVGYAFQLGLQKSGEYADMWMTESVVPLGEGVRSGTRI